MFFVCFFCKFPSKKWFSMEANWDRTHFSLTATSGRSMWLSADWAVMTTCSWTDRSTTPTGAISCTAICSRFTEDATEPTSTAFPLVADRQFWVAQRLCRAHRPDLCRLSDAKTNPEGQRALERADRPGKRQKSGAILCLLRRSFCATGFPLWPKPWPKRGKIRWN